MLAIARNIFILFSAGLIFLALACGVSTEDVDATVEARIASIPTPTPLIVIQEVEVIKEVVVESEVIKEVPVEVEKIVEKIVEVEVEKIVTVRESGETVYIEVTPTPTPIPLPTPTPTPIPGTQVGDMMLSQDTTWTVADSPYYVNGTVQIPQGVTLTLNHGVIAIMADEGTFKLMGNFVAAGTEQNPISISGDGLLFLAPEGATIRINHTTISGIQRLLSGDNVELSIYDSRLIDLKLDELMVVYPTGDTYTHEQHINQSTLTMERNVFKNVGTIQVFNSVVTLRFNCFDGQPPLFRQFRPGNLPNKINFNSIYGVTAQAIENGSWGRASLNPSDIITEVIKIDLRGTQKDVDATQNYWDGLTEQDIEKLIYDKHDDISIDKEVAFLPVLTEPHPDTPNCGD